MNYRPAIVAGALFFSSVGSFRIGYPLIIFGSGYYEDIANRVDELLIESDVISAEAIGYIGHLLPNQPILDPLGLTDRHIAKYGWPAITYGKKDMRYILEEAKPSLMIWHWGGHLQGFEEIVKDNYITYCRADCNNRNADLVLIRKDVAIRFEDAFTDWTKIEDLTQMAD